MQRGREGRNDNFGMVNDQFGNFRGFGMMMPSLFGGSGRDPFDDPFFTRPFGSLFESSASMFQPPTTGFRDVSNSSSSGVVIQELISDDDDEEVKEIDPRIGSGVEPSVQHPDDDDDDHFDGEEKEKNVVNHRNDYNKIEGTKPQARSFSFHTSKVTYGGVDGAYYTSTRTRRAGNDGVIVEENKEADKRTGQATHRISRGLHDKGHSVTRKLNSDGKVDTVQTLHNLNEDELSGFEAAWNGNIKKQPHDWRDQFATNSTSGYGNSEWTGIPTSSGWVLPAAEQPRNTGVPPSRRKNVVRINIE